MTLSPLQKIARLVAIVQQARVDTGALPADPTAARVLALPYRTGISAEDYAAVAKRFVLDNPAPNPDGTPFRLWEIQAEALHEFMRHHGLLAPIGIGWGKTMIAQLAFEYCFASLGLERMVLFVPANLVYQLVRNMLPRLRRQVRISFEVHVLAGKGPDVRAMVARRGRPGLYILSYSMASATGKKDGDTDQFARLLDTIGPEVVGLDECHNVKNPRSGRTHRIFQYLQQRMPLGFALSGTITAKEIEDYWHIALWCVREQIPMPTTKSELREWGLCLNSKSTPSNVQLATMAWLRDWAQARLPGDQKLQQPGIAGLRAAYRVRLVSAPGVVATGDQEIEASLIMTNRSAALQGHGADLLRKHIDDIERAGITPSGDVIEHAIHGYKWLYELTAGFYNELYWEEPARLAERTKISESEAEGLLELALDHYQAGQAYAKELRTWFQWHKVDGLDTPFWVGAEMERHGPAKVGEELYQAWREMKDLELEGLPERQSRCVRVCGYKVEEAADWACEEGQGVVWYYNQEVGEWLSEVLRDRGLPHAFCPAGDVGNARIDDEANMLCVASISAHGTGKNLQRMNKQLFLQWPAAAVQAEQTLGRLHRNGQTEDVLTWTLMSSDWDQMLLASTLTNALYIQQTTGNRQRLIYCNWLEFPKVFPSDVLRERGFDNRPGKALDADLRGIFSEQAP